MSINAPNNKADSFASPSKLNSRPEAASNTLTNSTQTGHSAKTATSLESINIKVGQAIQAKVAEVLNIVSTRQTQSSFNVTLEIGGNKLAVKTNIQLQPGQVIELRVNAKGELILPKPASIDTNTLVTALSKVLPYQQPVGKVIAALLQNLPTIGADNSQIKQLATQLTTLLPKSESFSSSSQSNQMSATAPPASQLVKQAMSQSGIFMESTLANFGKQSSMTTPGSSSLGASLMTNTSTALAQAIRSVASADNLTSASTRSGNLTTSTAIPASSAAPADLKSTISQLIAALNTVYAEKHSATGQTSRFIGESDPNLLVNPFNFPSALNGLKTAAQSDRELSVGDLLKRLAGALNRIQFQQLNSIYQAQSASTETTSVQTWQMELPFLTPQNQIDSVQVRLDQEKGRNGKDKDGEKESTWKLALTFDLDRLGPIFIQVNLTPPTVSSTIWAEKQETLQLVNQEAQSLRESFSQLGLTVEDITCRQGQPNMRKTRLNQQIVDTKV